MQISAIAGHICVAVICLYAYFKLSGRNAYFNRWRTGIAFVCYIVSSLAVFLLFTWLPRSLMHIAVILLMSLCLYMLMRSRTGVRFRTVITTFLMAYAISWSSLFVLKPLLFASEPLGLETVNVLLAVVHVLQLFSVFCILNSKALRSTKRLSVSFADNTSMVFEVVLAGCVISLDVFYFSTIYETPLNIESLLEGLRYYVFNALVCVAGIVWVIHNAKTQRQLTLNLREIERLNRINEEAGRLEIEYKLLIEQFDKLRTAHHNVNSRLDALEHEYKIISLGDTGPTGVDDNEVAMSLEDIEKLSKELNSAVAQLRIRDNLSSTKVKMIDRLLIMYFDKFNKAKIAFQLSIKCNVSDLIDTYIPQSKLETLIANLLNNALSAINESTYPFRGVMMFIGFNNGNYEIAVFDSGIAFEVGVLSKLGTAYVTTHSNTGGSGIGFFTMFQTLSECRASLIISEKRANGSSYTKSVTIKFDGRNQYIIETFRPNEFPESDRYEIKEKYDRTRR